MRSPHQKWHVSTILAALAIAFSLALVAGCSSKVVAPKDDLIQEKLDWLSSDSHFGQGDLDRGPLPDCPILFDTLLTEWVDIRGDRFSAEFGQEHIDFQLPGGAVYLPVRLSIHVMKYQAPFGAFWMLDCGPDGSRFAKPLQVTPNNAALSASVAVLFYFNPTSGQWEVQQIDPAKDHKLLIYHFSKYGIS
jgi:hypothetical protein